MQLNLNALPLHVQLAVTYLRPGEATLLVGQRGAYLVPVRAEGDTDIDDACLRLEHFEVEAITRVHLLERAATGGEVTATSITAADGRPLLLERIRRLARKRLQLLARADAEIVSQLVARSPQPAGERGRLRALLAAVRETHRCAYRLLTEANDKIDDPATPETAIA